VIYCINPYCEDRENQDGADSCASCGVPLHVSNRLTLIRKISSDSEMDVFEVIDSQTTFSGEAGTHKILKVLKSIDPDRIKAFETETLILQSLQHPAIPKVDVISDYFEIDVAAVNRRLRCLVMSKFEGNTLEDHVLTHGAINQRTAIDYLQQLGSILHYIHTERLSDEWGVIHRDIKPGNIIVQPDGKLALIDFGFGLIMTRSYQSRLGTGIGEASRVETIYYTPPEQIARRPLPQSDFFALGMTLVFALTGRQLYEMEMVSWQPNWQKYVVKHLDAPFVQFLERLTSPDSFKRPGSAEEILNVVSDTLPAKLKWRARLRSTPYRIAIGAIAVLGAVGLFQLGRNALYEYYFINGNKAIEDNRFADARQKFATAIKVLPKAEAYSNLGVVCMRLGAFDCASEAYRAAIRINPKGWEGYFQLGSYYEDIVQPDIKQAEFYYRKALSINQQAVQPLNNLARVMILQKRYQEAKPLITGGLKVSFEPYYKSALNKNLGWLYLEQKQYAEAEKHLKQAIALDSTLASPYCLLARLYKAQKKPSAEMIESCLSTNGEDALNIEVLLWRNQMIQQLLRNHGTSISENVYPS
jgi:tetratricopeptide (TPR) repeat protein